MNVRCLPARRAGIRAAGTLVLAFALAACSDRAADAPAPAPEATQDTTANPVVANPTGGSCLTAALGVCQDFTGAGHAPAIVRGTCEDQQLAYSTAACTDEARLGTCLLFAGEPVESRLHYASTFPPGLDGAKSQCVDKLKGQWKP